MSDITQALMQMLRSVLEDGSAAYVCGPLTSGKTYYEKLARREATDGLDYENRALMASTARRLRQLLDDPVIDPGLLRIPGWTGPEYGRFFLDVLDQFGKAIYCCDDWEYSRGASGEFVFCIQKGVPAYTHQGRALSPIDGLQLMRNAARHIGDLGFDASWLQERVAKVRSIASLQSS